MPRQNINTKNLNITTLVVASVALMIVGAIVYRIIWPSSPEQPVPPPVPVEEPFDQKTLVVILLDGSGTYEYFQASIDRIAPANQNTFYKGGLIGKLGRDCAVCLILITNAASENDIVIPTVPIRCNEFDPNSRLASIKALSDQIRAIETPDTFGTDIYGALYQATGVLADEAYLDYAKYVYVFSDLADTIDDYHKYDVNLNGATVKVFFFSTDLEYEKNNTQIPDPDAWTNYFKEHGTDSVTITKAINSFNAKL